jgi:phosphoglycolate phosphatase
MTHTIDRSILSRVQNIIFDMDGTLADTAKVSIKACQEIALSHGLPVRDANIIRGTIGWADPEFYYRLYPEVDKQILHSYACDVARRERELTIHLKENILFPGVLRLINFLKQKNFYMAIASTGSKEHVESTLMASGIYSMFDTIKYGDPEKINSVGYIINKLKLERESFGISGNILEGSCIIIGDRITDLKAGKGNGIITIAARYGYGTEEEYKEFDFMIDQPLELLDLLGLSKDPDYEGSIA